MTSEFIKIYPKFKKVDVNNEYLKNIFINLSKRYKPYYYANFLMGVNGRIAIYDKKYKKLLTPSKIMSKNDFLIFCQLHAQSDCLVTNTNYLKGLSEGYYGDILSLKDSKLKKWKEKNKISIPKIIVISNSLNFKINKKILNHKDNMTILTTNKSKRKINNIKKHGIKFKKYNGKEISAKSLDKYIRSNKYKSIYFIAGPKIVENMIDQSLLDTLYCTTSQKLVGSKKYDTIVRGDIIEDIKDLDLRNIYITKNKKTKKIEEIYQEYTLK
tara:strand:+ start:2285 stop:3094 length:810 start_codon:yes stop_codon:yes gene_type:complete